VRRLAVSLPALLTAWLCSACLGSSGGSPEDNRPPVENPPASSQPSVENSPASRHSAALTNKEADHVFDSLVGLKGPPDKKVLKGRKLEFHVGFAVADPKDIVMELALHDDSERSSLLYFT
jgi:hypothetical protein